MKAADIHTPGAILAALCSTRNAGAYHWIIYLCTDPDKGEAFHATNELDQSPWRYEHKPWSALESGTCVLLSQIGRMASYEAQYKQEFIDNLDSYLSLVELKLQDVDRGTMSRFTCRAWFRAAIRKLHDAGVYVYCPDVLALERKLLEAATGLEFQAEERPLGREIELPVALIASPLATPWS
ncbi:hypothetical protein BD414DRAFT_195675 [Trametes punicea]|nr:hypothetical protein BD414DRAFT_195675 [Trametes punicea]